MKNGEERRSMVSRVDEFFTKRLWRLDLETLGQPQAFVVKLLRLLTVSVRDLSESLINLRAMSMVYTTLLSLVPLLAVSFSVLKAFGVHNQMEPMLANFLAPLGPKGEEITHRIIGFVENLNVGVLGSLGLAMLVYTVISLIQKMEEAFNEIWRVRRRRSFARRFSEYMSVLLIGPVLVFTGLGLTASLMSSALVTKAVAIEPVGTAVLIAGKLVPFLMVYGAFTFMYIFVPGTKVYFRSALVGGFVATLLWHVAGMGFASFAVSSTKYAAIYSTFAILILFMIWLYLSWLIILLGAKVAFYYQYPHFLRVRKEAILLNNRLGEKLALVIMSLVGSSHYFDEKRWELDTLLERLKLPLEPVQEVIALLEKKGLLLESCEDSPGYIPGRDIETIPLAEVVECVRSPGGDSGFVEERYLSLPGVDEVSRGMEEAVRSVLGDRTVKDLVLEGSRGREDRGQVRS